MDSVSVSQRRNVFVDENDDWNIADFPDDDDKQHTGSNTGARLRSNMTGAAQENKSSSQDNLNDDGATQLAEDDEYDVDSKETRLTLLEELLLLGLKDKEGHTSFWNDSLSSGLRGAILIELALLGKIALESSGMRKKNLLDLRVIVKRDGRVGDVLLDEAFKHIKENSQTYTVRGWIDYLSGETWNPMRLKYQLKNVRERIAKNLTEKGVCTTEMQNFVVFNMTTHPLIDSTIKERIVRKIQEGVQVRWCTDVQKFNKRTLALIMLAQASDVLENALAHLSDEDYDLSMNRIRELNNLDYNNEGSKENALAIMWAVFLSYDM